MLLQEKEVRTSCNDRQSAVVECQGLTKIFRRPLASRTRAVCALRDVSLTVRQGQIIGLIGPNGAGKSTLLNLVAGLIRPTEGRVTVCGHSVESVAAHRRLGYMPEHPVFPGHYSARAVLRYHGALLGLSVRDISGQVERSMQWLQLQDYVDRPASDFSQGMKQRLALAIALMSDPQLLLLDEPSNGLDPIGIIQLRDLLQQLRDSGTTIIISSHRLGELEKLTADYLFMYKGQIVSSADGIAASGAGQLRVELAPQGAFSARAVLPDAKILKACDTELVIAIRDPEEVPELVSKLVLGGARIMGVLLQRESIEDVFLRLCHEG